MTLGITGNPTKDALWPALGDLLPWLGGRADVCLDDVLAKGLAARGHDGARCHSASVAELARRSDVLLSFGGDGSMLRTAHAAADGDAETPILGVNLGRLGFLTKVEVSELHAVLDAVIAGDFSVEHRMVLDVATDGLDLDAVGLPRWALNDVVVDKSGTTSMISIEAEAGGAALNTYWADGLILATPTGSTAYALSVGGPIVAPGSEVVVVAPIAPHTLTARPIVLPCDAELTLRVSTRDHPYAFAVDGVSVIVDADGVTIRVARSAHTVPLVTMPGRDYFTTIREKLSWGAGSVF